MIMPAYGQPPLQNPRRYPGLVISGLLLLLLSQLSCGSGSPDATVSRDLRSFFEAFVGRELTGTEVRDVSIEFIELHTEQGKAPDAIRDMARQLDGFSKPLRSNAATPAALQTRHALVESHYLNPDLHDTIMLRLMTEPDPIRVVDVRSRRVMTERDVIALANLRRFASSGGEPRHHQLSQRQIEALIAALQAAVGGNSGNMPRFFGEAATFWAGVQQEWPNLDDRQKSLVRAYADRTWRVQMPVEMYGRLWGLNPQAASSRYADDVGARIAGITDINMRLGNLPFVMDAIFGR
jgi:hypothetical protein